MQLDPSPLERWFTARPGPIRLSLASTAVTAWTPAELARWLPAGWADRIDWNYGEPQGDPGLRELIAADLGLPDRDHVLLTAGAVEANFLALASLLGPGDEAWVQAPIYPQLPCVAAATGAAVRAWDLDPARLGPATRVAALNTPHNPTGVVAEVGAIAARVRSLPRAYLLVDEVYRGVGEAEPPPPALRALGPDRVLTSDSTSKALALPGARVGWLAGDAEAIRTGVVWREHTTLALAGPAVAAVKALWPHRAELLAINQAVIARNRARLLGWLAERPWLGGSPSPHTGAFLLGYADARPFDDVATCAAWYAEERVLAIPGTTLGYPGRVRVGFGQRDEAVLEANLAFLDGKLHAARAAT